MGRDRNERDLALLGPVTPEHPVGAWGAVLGVGLEHFFLRVQGIWQGREGMRVEPWMAWALGAELANAALPLLKEAKLFGLAPFANCRLGGLLQLLKLGCGFRSPEDLKTHASGSSSLG